LPAGGELPTFGRLIREGAHSDTFGVISPHSPVAWTSIATSRKPEDHGVTDYVSHLPTGGVIPVTSNMRRVHALWNIATGVGRSVGVVGWWASWPAEEVEGYVVTDHANPAARSLWVADRRYWTADEATLATFEADVFPPELVSVVRRHHIGPDDFPYEELERRGAFPVHQAGLLRAEPWHQRTPYSVLKSTFAVDLFQTRVARELLRTVPTDLTMVYLRGPDAVQHYAWDLVEPERYAVPSPTLERDRGLVEGVYRTVDSFLADLLAAAPAESWVVVASDHGAEPSPGATGARRMDRPGAHTAAAEGVLFMRGPGVVPGRRIEHASGYDVMPTILWLMGLPIARNLEGRVLREAFDPGFAEGRPAS
jgi:predicted AlkP superfamily phosphohydrolase/phosphomutase